MINPKALIAQTMEILRAREARGERLGLLCYQPEEIRNIPTGAICFIPGAPLSEDTIHRVAKWGWAERALHAEPIFIATDDTEAFYMLPSHGETELVDISNISENWIDPDEDEEDPCGHYVLVVDDLNIPVQDSRMINKPVSVEAPPRSFWVDEPGPKELPAPSLLFLE
jgi:hypothetical protein